MPWILTYSSVMYFTRQATIERNTVCVSSLRVFNMSSTDAVMISLPLQTPNPPPPKAAAGLHPRRLTPARRHYYHEKGGRGRRARRRTAPNRFGPKVTHGYIHSQERVTERDRAREGEVSDRDGACNRTRPRALNSWRLVRNRKVLQIRVARSPPVHYEGGTRRSPRCARLID